MTCNLKGKIKLQGSEIPCQRRKKYTRIFIFCFPGQIAVQKWRWALEVGVFSTCSLLVLLQAFTSPVTLLRPSDFYGQSEGGGKTKLTPVLQCESVVQVHLKVHALLWHVLWGNNRLITYTKSWIQHFPCCTLLRNLLFFTNNFQFHLLSDIHIGIMLALIYIDSGNPKYSSIQKLNQKSHFISYVITLMTLHNHKGCPYYSCSLNHCSSWSICTVQVPKYFSCQHGPHRYFFRAIRITLSLNNGASDHHSYLFVLWFFSSMRPSFLYFHLTNTHEISQGTHWTRCFLVR